MSPRRAPPSAPPLRLRPFDAPSVPSTPPASSPPLLLVVLLLILLPPASCAGESTWESIRRYLYGCWQTAMPYTDPDNLCSAGATGYRATSDCRGYVYCHNGYLMGGGSEAELVNSVIPCGSGQLFDNDKGACTSSLRTCPGGGGSSRPKSSQARAPPTRRPTRRPSPNASPPPPTRRPSPSGAGSGVAAREGGNPPPSRARPPSAAMLVSSASEGAPSPEENPPPTSRPSRRPTRRPDPTRGPSRRPTALPTPPTASRLVAHGAAGGAPPPPTPRPEMAWVPAPEMVWLPAPEGAAVSLGREAAPGGDDFGLTNDEYLYGSRRDSYYCAARWADLNGDGCRTASPCPTGRHSDCPAGQNCFPGTTCASLESPATPTAERTGEDPRQSAPARAVPSSTGAVASEPAGRPRSSTDGERNRVAFCNSDRDCPSYRFCNSAGPGLGGYCADCLLSNGRGCSTEQVCRTTTCDPRDEPGLPTCHYRWRLNNYCALSLGDASAKCDLDAMRCEGRDGTWGGAMVAARASAEEPPPHLNPAGNGFFCGGSHASFSETCLRSRPCPGGLSTLCPPREGCFFVPGCAEQYERVGAVAS